MNRLDREISCRRHLQECHLQCARHWRFAVDTVATGISPVHRGRDLSKELPPLFSEEVAPPASARPNLYSTSPRTPDLFGVRKRLAHEYLRGRGVEFGALHSPLDVPLWLQVRYADMETADELRRSFPDIEN